MTERDIFIAALQQEDPAQRQAYLDAACAERPELRQQVEDLLRRHDGAGSFLESPAVSLAPTWVGHETAEQPPSPEVPGTMIGPYKLLEPIGEGGMGTVWMAQQTEPVKRLVALKLIKAGMDSRQVLARFEAERQALALMDHPNIARVLDAGTSSAGRPFFVMDLVKGVSITRYCDEHRLTPRQRLELFIPVCQAVQHAHQKGIIHRDLKPSNVLVALYDGKPVPKVIDFGVAKAAGQQLTDRTLVTGFGAIVGTLEYMSPEQAELNQLDIDTRSDIYSLGVLLYELLTGTTPFTRKGLEKTGMLEMLRRIREQEPSKPSTKLGTAEGLPTLAANRGTEPAKLAKLVRGELDWIVMKALEKDRNRRYETANGFAADVQRYLNDEPVLACPPSVGYRLGKFLRRHRAPVLAVALVMVLLTGGVVGTTWGLLRATDAEARAVNETSQKEAALTDARYKWFLSLVQQARAERTSARVGQRFEALAAIRKAAGMRVTPELRTEAIAALVQPDAEVVQEWAGLPEDTHNLAFDAAYQRYARMDSQGGITVCQVRDGREEAISTLPTRVKPGFGGLWMSPDGRYLAYGESLTPPGRTATVWVWKLDGRTAELHFEVPEGMYEAALAFHANSRLLALGHADGSVSVYDLATARRVQRLAIGAAPFSLAFHPRDGRLAVPSGDAVKLFDAETARELPALRQSGTRVGRAAWHPDGRCLVVRCSDHKIHCWDAQTATEILPPLETPTGTGYKVAFNRAGNRLVMRGDDADATVVWDLASGRRLLTLPATAGDASPDDRILGYAVNGGNLQLWGMTDNRELQVLHCRKEGRLDLQPPVVDASGRVLATCAGPWLTFYDLDRGEELASVQVPPPAWPVFFDPPRDPDPADRKQGEEAGGWVIGGASALYRWPLRTGPGALRVGPPVQVVPDPTRGGFSAGSAASSDGRLVAMPQGTKALVFDRDRPGWRLELGPQFDVRRAAVSPDGTLVATCSHWRDDRTNSVRVWDVKTGRQVWAMLEGLARAAFSPDGRWLVTESDSGVQLWEVGTWREVRKYDRAFFAFSPDSRLLAIGDTFGAIRLLEITTGREVARLTGPEPGRYAPQCFTPDGTRLIATCPPDIYVWDLRLIRKQLQGLGLDWEWPDFPPPGSSDRGGAPLAVEVHLGDLVKSREQRQGEAIADARRRVAANPNDARACNSLAWHFATAPEPLRDAKAAVPLAENAVRLMPKNALYANTLGVAYYRAGQFREAADVLRANLANQKDTGLAHDLYFLAMSYHRLGESPRARDYYDWAVRWTRTQRDLSADDMEELNEFRAEAGALLGIEDK